MNQIQKWHNESSYIQPLSPACKMCANGSKMVLLITGLCPSNCYYCPLSFKKSKKDVIYANEWKLKNESDTEKIIKEAHYINAEGAGITGGDPLTVYNRTKKYIQLLKDTFGEKFHIHLYTSGLQKAEHIPDIISAGLDEIRFHPEPKHWDKMHKSPIKKPILESVKTGIDVAIEIPAIPKKETQIHNLIEWADQKQIKYINLNELEFSEKNQQALTKLGYHVKSDISAAAVGSQKTALKVIETISKLDLNIGVHYCSVSFKDGVQLKNRIKRRAKNIKKEFEVITEDGTLLKGAIYNKNKTLPEIKKILMEQFEIPEKYLIIDKEKNRIEIGLWILEKIAFDLKQNRFECYMVEEYPTADRLEVEKIPLPL